MPVHVVETIKLTSLGLDAFNPVFSPDGSKIAFSARSKEASCQVYIVNIDGSGLTRLTDEPGPNCVVCFSPDGTKIAYIGDPTGEDDNYYDIYTMSPDGSNKQRLTYSGGAEPAFSSDGSLISFVSDDNEIFLMNNDGSNSKQLTPIRWNEASRKILLPKHRPIFSPDGKWVYFLSTVQSRDKVIREVYRIRLDGSDINRLSHTDDDVVDYIISPDGQTIAFALFYVDQLGVRRSSIYTIRSDGSDRKQIAEGKGTNWMQSFSPDGKWIAFYSNRDGKSTDITRNWDIYLIRTDGSELVRLTDNNSLDMEPVFSPDGSMIAFSSDHDGNREIYLAHISY